MYEIIVNVLYHESHLQHFKDIRNPCDGATPIIKLIPTADSPIIDHNMIRGQLYQL